MSSIPTLPGITSKIIETSRIKTHTLTSGPDDGTPVLFIHGNASSSTFWEEIMLMLPKGFRAIAPDLRGYGDTEDLLIDATRGLGDWVDDLLSLLDTLGIDRVHAAGHSLGGTMLCGLIGTAPERIMSATAVNPGPLQGFGGCKGPEGESCYDDCAGSGGGIVNPDFPRLMAAGDRSTDNPQGSPRVVMNSFYWKPPFRPEREEDLLSSLMSEHIGDRKYPGDFVPSPNWPGTAPGRYGPINAVSPKYAAEGVQRFLSADPKPPVLWIRGDSDQIVSDNSLFDVGTLGKLGAVPGWPGDEVFPPQPMVAQTRYLLTRYGEAGGEFREVVIADTGHTPYVEKPTEFMKILTNFLE